MRRTLPLFLVLALGAQSSFAADPAIIARMGEISLSESDARLLLQSSPAEARSGPALEKLIRTELIRRGVAAEARRQGFDKKAEVKARMEQAAEQVLVTSYMNNIAQPPADFPSAELLKQAYDANKEALMSPRQFRVSQIYVAGKDDKARKLAEELGRDARRKNADFAALARKSSQHAASAAKGGDMGWLSETELVPLFRQALTGLDKGEVAAPIAGPEGWHILKRVERKEPELQPLEKVRDALARTLRLRKAAEIEQAYLEAMLKRTPVSVNGIALEELGKR
jgi:peptidylprolyl isomerase